MEYLYAGCRVGLRRGFLYGLAISRDQDHVMGAQPISKLEFAEPTIHVDWTGAFSRLENRKALTYWNSIRGDRQMPDRRDLSPRAMREFLTYVNLVDVRHCSNGVVEYEVAL